MDIFSEKTTRMSGHRTRTWDYSLTNFYTANYEIGNFSILCNQVLWDIFTAAEQTGFHVGNVTFCGADPMVQKLWVQIQSIVTLIRFPSQVVGHSGLS